MKFPFFDLTRQYARIKDEMTAKFASVMSDQSFILGEAVTQFEKEIAAWLGVAHAISTSSGTDALIVALNALRVGPGDEVITTPFSFYSTAAAILFVGAKPIFVDIDPRTFNLDVSKVGKAITRYTKAILPVHLFGQTVDMKPLMELARRHGVAVVEDFAQSLGAKDRGQAAGAMGTVGVTSFYPNKNLGGVGDGGLIVTDDHELARRIRMGRLQSTERRSLPELLGTHGRMDGLQAAYLSVKFKHLGEWTQLRQNLAQRYAEKLGALVDVGVLLPQVVEGKFHSWNQYVIRVPQRDHIRKLMALEGVPTEVLYPVTLPQQKALRGFCGERGWPEAERAARSVLALPLFPELTEPEQDDVIAALTKALRASVRKESALSA